MAKNIVTASLHSEDFDASDIHISTIDGTERIGDLFELDVVAVCRRHDAIDVANLAGSEAAVVFEIDGVEARRMHGVISEVLDGADPDSEERTLLLKLAPRMIRLALVETQQIYLDMSVPEIVSAKLELVGLEQAMETRLTAEYPKREFVVEYKESDLAFVKRLCEHLGVSFCFVTGDDMKDRVLFVDHEGGFPELADSIAVRRGEAQSAPCISVTPRARIVPSVFVERDYNYRTPRVDVAGTAKIDAYAGGVVEFGGHVKTPKEAEALAKIRAEERRATQLVYEGAVALPTIASGHRGKLVGHPRLGDLSVLFTSMRHHLKQTLAMASDGAKSEYRGAFTAIPADRTYRPPRVTPRPRIDGVVTGVIDGEGSGSNGYAKLDDQGRYLVRFWFDPSPEGGNRASRWCRMAQPHAGADYGMHFPLKPGAEVLVAFADGDPDRPIVIGAVPNPTVPSPVVSKTGNINRIRTSSGVTLDIHDGVPRKN